MSIMVKAEEIGYVDTVFKFFGANHKIVIEAFDDPEVKNVTCYLSRAKTGGISGSLCSYFLPTSRANRIKRKSLKR